MKQFLKRLLLKWRSFRRRNRPCVIPFLGNRPNRRKWALVSYLPDAINLKDGDKRLSVHSNWWECREIARILFRLGYNVEAMSFDDMKTIPDRRYDLVFDIERNLARLAPFQKPETKFLMMLTGSYLPFAVEAERKRVDCFNNRNHIGYQAKYARMKGRNLDASLRVADKILLIGNETTKRTYPEWSFSRMRHCPVTIVPPVSWKETPGTRPSFLYFFSGRNVAKGLDLVLEAMNRHTDWTLHVAGGIDEDFPFRRLSGRNIVYDGFVKPDSKRFGGLIERVSAFVAPTCSEGTSPAVLTCMCAGLYPIVSKNAGVDLPDGCGIVIADLASESVEKAMSDFLQIPEEEVDRQTRRCRNYVLSKHSRESFVATVESALLEMTRV